MIRRVCCVCQLEYGTREGPDMVTHGFCPKHLEEELRRLRVADPDSAPIAVAAILEDVQAEGGAKP